MRRGVSTLDVEDCAYGVAFSRVESSDSTSLSRFFLFLPTKREKTGLFDANTHFTEPKKRDAAHAPTVPKMLRKCAKSKRLLDALEHGVFDALKKGYLRSVALVISHPEDHSTLLEEYLFTVEYDGAKRARLLATLLVKKRKVTKHKQFINYLFI